MDENNILVHQYIEKQAILSAIETFSQKHDEDVFEKDQKKYQELLPSKVPGKGQQYAFEVDLDKCTGCKACVTGCHNENGLEEGETWRSVGLVQGGTNGNSAIQHITSACHHCVEPACMSGCPTKAYVKDDNTGIVKHLDDQCFGCQYCILKCPYDVPKYNKKKGIVHKCDMCVGRLEVGQAPACVRACPNGAIKIRLVDVDEVKKNAKEYVDVPDSPDSNYTFPTTKYTSSQKIPENMGSVDSFSIKPEHSHFPLVFMLVLTQLSVGAYLAEGFLQRFIDSSLAATLLPFHALVALVVGFVALNSSIFHLGRPLYAFRAILGFKTSWLSREIIAFGLFAFLATLYASVVWFSSLSSLLGFFGSDILPVLVFGSGVIGILCSVFVYKDTKRPFWDHPATAIKYFLTMIILGFATILLSSMIYAYFNSDIHLSYLMLSFGNTFCLVHGVMVSVKLFFEGSVFVHLNDKEMTPFKKTALLMTGPLRKTTIWRFVCGFIGGVFMPFLLMQNNTQVSDFTLIFIASFVFLFSLVGEFLERYLFFRAVVPLKMPGGKI